ncbi:MAG TPA: YifB family Mg chelatase-like AAA ATPase [Mycobacteriales bacterium]|jgi:magnesium chelatase family protein|nr:YifB family Mg chelatase-like AAA ATPase [Mycobacteriales bacterium]
MGLGRALSIGLVGLDGHVVEVEADLAAGLPAFVLIGLPDATMQEARDRVRAAVVNSGCAWPQRRITLALSPAALPKRGSAFDLAMAVAVLAASESVPPAAVEGLVLLGELSLDGRVRPVPGVLPAAFAAWRAGVRRLVVPAANVAEAALVPDVEVLGFADLAGLLAYLRGEAAALVRPGEAPAVAGPDDAVAGPDLADVLGQDHARRCLEVAAAGGHHVFLLGPPGAGKTMLAERLPTILPRLGDDAALEVSAIHSVAGTLPPDAPLVTVPPFRAPHHSASLPALIGGGSGVARPGEVSLAHRGVLFLDEAPEFATGHLDALRQPLESGHVTLARAGGVARYPARFTLVLAANPCPCSTAGQKDRDCTCPAGVRRRYLGRLSGPLLDRVDIRVEVASATRVELTAGPGEPSAAVRDRVLAARERMAHRYRGLPWTANADVPGRELRRRWPLAADALAPAHAAVDTGRLSARGLDRVVRVAWTLADLEGRAAPGASHVRRAVSLRKGTTP